MLTNVYWRIWEGSSVDHDFMRSWDGFEWMINITILLYVRTSSTTHWLTRINSDLLWIVLSTLSNWAIERNGTSEFRWLFVTRAIGRKFSSSRSPADGVIILTYLVPKERSFRPRDMRWKLIEVPCLISVLGPTGLIGVGISERHYIGTWHDPNWGRHPSHKQNNSAIFFICQFYYWILPWRLKTVIHENYQIYYDKFINTLSHGHISFRSTTYKNPNFSNLPHLTQLRKPTEGWSRRIGR